MTTTAPHGINLQSRVTRNSDTGTVVGISTDLVLVRWDTIDGRPNIEGRTYWHCVITPSGRVS